jgi:hypothetical protein
MSRHKPHNDDQKILHIEEEILRETRETREIAQETHREVEELERRLRPKRLTKSIAISFSGASTMNTLTLNVGQSSIGTITPLAADGVTPSGGTVSAASFSIPTDPSFGAVDNGDGTVTVTGLAASTSPVTGTASCTVTDTDGAVSTFTQTFTITVAGGPPPPPPATTTSIGVSFSTPV